MGPAPTTLRTGVAVAGGTGGGGSGPRRRSFGAGRGRSVPAGGAAVAEEEGDQQGGGDEDEAVDEDREVDAGQGRGLDRLAGQAPDLGGGDGAHDRDADRDADLLGQRGDAGGQALLLVGQARGGGDHEADDGGDVGVAAEEGQAQDSVEPAAGVTGEVQCADGDALDEQAGDEHGPAAAEDAYPAGGGDASEEGADAEDAEGQAGGDGRVAQDFLQVEGESVSYTHL